MLSGGLHRTTRSLKFLFLREQSFRSVRMGSIGHHRMIGTSNLRVSARDLIHQPRPDLLQNIVKPFRKDPHGRTDESSHLRIEWQTDRTALLRVQSLDDLLNHSSWCHGWSEESP